MAAGSCSTGSTSAGCGRIGSPDSASPAPIRSRARSAGSPSPTTWRSRPCSAGRAAGQSLARSWLAFTGLEARADALPDELNLLERKFLDLARALASEPRLVLLDEVLSGLTPAQMTDALRLVRRIRDRGTTVVF